LSGESAVLVRSKKKIRSHILDTAVDLDPTGHDPTYEADRIDAIRTVR